MSMEVLNQGRRMKQYSGFLILVMIVKFYPGSVPLVEIAVQKREMVFRLLNRFQSWNCENASPVRIVRGANKSFSHETVPGMV